VSRRRAGDKVQRGKDRRCRGTLSSWEGEAGIRNKEVARESGDLRSGFDGEPSEERRGGDRDEDDMRPEEG
jgi:hypothetical protein